MTLRADQWMMVGVVSIGALAAYLLTRSGPRPLTSPVFGPAPSPPPYPPASAVPTLQQNILRPGPPGQPSSALLRRGTNVLGRLELGDGDRAGDRAGDEATAIRNLQIAGFTNVSLFTRNDIAANPSLVPLRDALSNPGPGSRWFFATWNGNGTVASGSIVMPREVTLLWYTSTAPPPRLAFAAAPGGG